MTTNILVVPPECHGKRLDQALSLLLPQYSRSQLSNWIKNEQIKLNDKTVKPKEKVFVEDKIQVDFEDSLDKAANFYIAENIPLDIVFEDEEIIVINKPAGLVVHPGAGNYQNTLANALLFHAPILKNIPRAGIIHRLDKDTTGLLVVAKTLIAHTDLVRQLQERNVERFYTTLVKGHLIASGEINTFYGRNTKNRLKMAVCTSGKEAITQYYVKKQYNYYTLLAVKLLTGRTHQIRVHMAHINHPIVGDPLYGGRMQFPPKASETLIHTLKSFKRQALHAFKLGFQHPINRQPLCFQAPLPQDLSLLVQLLDEELG
jgi:23S rRNA pseudouridine1911/1915/1917 synthase